MQTVQILVLGDVMIDSYYHGKVSRISPEAPVPVVNVSSVKQYPGGAGNVVSNLSGLGASTHLIAMVGRDDAGRWLGSYYKENKVNFTPLEGDKPTIQKSRVLGGRQQMLRFDTEDTTPISADEEEQVLALAASLDLSKISGIVISDYNKGFCTPGLCRGVLALAEKKGIPVFVDPKGNDWQKYEGAAMVTPNLNELSAVYGEKIENSDDAVVAAATEIRKRFRLNSLLVTRSEMGMTLVSDDGVKHFPTVAREVYDVSGAGDTVMATASYLLASGAAPEEAVKLANQAAGIAVGHSGTWVIDRPTFDSMIHRHFHGSSDAAGLASQLRSRGKRIVFTNGCFDILHRGHVDYLRRTAELGDILIVGLNSDESVKRLKGPERPVNDQESRAEVLGALDCVDHVIIFDEDTPYNLIKAIKPDVLTKGGDYTPETVVGREFAGETVIISLVEGHSTTGIIERMREDG